MRKAGCRRLFSDLRCSARIAFFDFAVILSRVESISCIFIPDVPSFFSGASFCPSPANRPSLFSGSVSATACRSFFLISVSRLFLRSASAFFSFRLSFCSPICASAASISITFGSIIAAAVCFRPLRLLSSAFCLLLSICFSCSRFRRFAKLLFI
mgnify:CR=1 FL=1